MSDEIRSSAASGRAPVRPATDVLKRSADQAWTRPDLSGLKLEYRFTSSVVENFAAGHKPADVFRELVQNEYDAEGLSMNIAFDEDALRVTGSGKPIDAVGWKRLSVMMGTGRVAGSEDRIAEKVNDLGSKNFGVRSLFRFGDQIFIHSRGRMTVLDLQAGAPPQPIPNPGSKRAVGVRIEVPYRTRPSDKLEPFTKEREAQAFDEVFAELSPTLVKLAQPGGRKDLRALTITSQRLGFTVRWRQSVKEERTRLSGYRILRRVATLEETRPAENGAPNRRSMRVEELEFQKSVTLPPEHQKRKFPGYFRLRGGKVRVAVSLRINRDRIDLDHAGCYFYPLGALSHLTGTAVSVSAPFDMNTDRSQVIENDWNTWLLERAADAVIELLGGDWLARFGGDAYLALRSRSMEPFFSKLVNERLRVAPCWPTRARTGKRKQAPVLHSVTTLVTYQLGDLGGFVDDEKTLEDRMRSGHQLREMAEYGWRSERCGPRSSRWRRDLALRVCIARGGAGLIPA